MKTDPLMRVRESLKFEQRMRAVSVVKTAL